MVAVQYNRPDGQDRKWTGGFLGIGPARMMVVDSSGFSERGRPITTGGLRVCYEDDLENEIVEGADGTHDTYENEDGIYFTGFKKCPLVVFAVAKPENYLDYFMTKEEKKIRQRAHDGNPYGIYPPDEHELNKKYSGGFYGLDPHYRETMTKWPKSTMLPATIRFQAFIPRSLGKPQSNFFPVFSVHFQYRHSRHRSPKCKLTCTFSAKSPNMIFK